MTRYAFAVIGAFALAAGALALGAPAYAEPLHHIIRHAPALAQHVAHQHPLLTIAMALGGAARLETKDGGDGHDLEMELKHVTADLADAVDGFKVKYDDRLDRIETAMKRLGRGGVVDTSDAPTPEQKAFNGFMRYGAELLPEAERKSLTVGNDTAGGYLVPAQFEREILKNVVLMSPVRNAARVGSMSASEILIPRRTSSVTGYWVGETEDRSATQSAYGQAQIVAQEMACYVDVSVKLLEDSIFSVEAEVGMDIGEEFARLEGAAFVNGDGLKKPFGLMVDPDIAVVNSGTATTIKDANGQANGLIDALYALPPFYRNRATWMMNGTTLASVRKMKDGQNNYIWAVGVAPGQPDTILGRPVIEAPDMPNEGAGTTPIIVGDFMSGYRIYDRVGMSLLRDPFTQATSGLVRFHARRRVGADVVKAEAFRKVKCST